MNLLARVVFTLIYVAQNPKQFFQTILLEGIDKKSAIVYE